MIAFLIYVLIYVLLLWLVWRWLCRSTSSYVEIARKRHQPPDAVDHYPRAFQCQ
jgi:hypothetical protein